MTDTEAVLPEEDFVGLINIVGEIGPSSYETYYTGGYDHDLYMDYIDQMMLADNNKGIMLYVDSPGGTVYESDELYLKLMEYKEVTGRPVWAYFASQACSGGYYISMAADKIYANRNCWTGSIGVVISLMNMEGLYDKLGLEQIDLVSGANKTIGSATSEMTEEQREILQGLVDEAYDQFVSIIVNGRGMSEEKVRMLGDGRIYSANQALENGLIDKVGSFEEAKVAFEQEQQLVTGINYHVPESGMSDLFGGLLYGAQKLIPKSETEVANDILEECGNGVLKYYAE